MTSIQITTSIPVEEKVKAPKVPKLHSLNPDAGRHLHPLRYGTMEYDPCSPMPTFLLHRRIDTDTGTNAENANPSAESNCLPPREEKVAVQRKRISYAAGGKWIEPDTTSYVRLSPERLNGEAECLQGISDTDYDATVFVPAHIRQKDANTSAGNANPSAESSCLPPREEKIAGDRVDDHFDACDPDCPASNDSKATCHYAAGQIPPHPAPARGTGLAHGFRGMSESQIREMLTDSDAKASTCASQITSTGHFTVSNSPLNPLALPTREEKVVPPDSYADKYAKASIIASQISAAREHFTATVGTDNRGNPVPVLTASIWESPIIKSFAKPMKLPEFDND